MSQCADAQMSSLLAQRQICQVELYSLARVDLFGSLLVDLCVDCSLYGG